MKILLLKNNVPDEAVLKKGLEIAKSLCPFPLEFREETTATEFPSVPFAGSSPEVSSGWQVNPYHILEEEKKFGNYEVVCLVFDPVKIKPTPPTNPTDNGEVIQIPSNWYASYPESFTFFFLHELCHHMFWKFSRPDRTHDFYTSPFAQKPNGHIEYLVSLLKEFPENKPPKLYAVLDRIVLTKKETIGSFKAQNGAAKFSCKSLELSWKNNKPNVSSIPKGKYEVKYTWSPRFQKFTYEVQKVPGRSGIRIHVANYFSQLNGCIALGNKTADINKDGEEDVINSTITIRALEDFFGRQPFTLEIL